MRLHRPAATFFALLFLVGAAVQWNDPDPLLWIAAYLACAGLSFAAAAGRRLFVPNVSAAIVFGLWLLMIAPSLWGAPLEAFTSFRMNEATHEAPREAMGLALLCAWSAWLAWRARPGGDAGTGQAPQAPAGTSRDAG